MTERRLEPCVIKSRRTEASLMTACPHVLGGRHQAHALTALRDMARSNYAGEGTRRGLSGGFGARQSVRRRSDRPRSGAARAARESFQASTGIAPRNDYALARLLALVEVGSLISVMNSSGGGRGG